MSWGLDGFIIVWLLSSLAEGAAMWLLAWPTWRKIMQGERLIGPWRGLARDIQGFGRFILTTNFDITLRELAPNLAPLTIGWMLGPAAAGLFTLAQKTTALLQQPAILIGQASYAVLAEQVARRRFDLLRATVWRSAALVLAIGLLFVLALAVVGDPLMRLLGGHSFAGGTVIITLLAGARAAALVSAPLTAGLTALGRPQRSLAVTLFTNLLLYPLLPLLILWLGFDGAGWHAIGQSLIATVMLALFFLRDSRGE
jgi:O-antigen/teichoic acid export membrane protein